MEIPTRLINLLNIVSWNAKKIFGSWMGQERYKKANYAFLIESSLAISLPSSRLHPVTNSLTSNSWQGEVTIKKTENRTRFRR